MSIRDVLITMFTDISLCSITGRGSYAIWTKENGVRRTHSGMFINPISDSTYAEGAAIVNGIYFILTTIMPPPGSKIIVQTDSTGAIAIMHTPHDRYKEISERKNKLLLGKSIEIEYRHVKGHRGTVTRRNAVNTWCDQECRRVLREFREGLK